MEMLVVKSKVKEVAEGMNVSGDFAETLNKLAVEEVKMAAKRAVDNNRKTVSAKDVFVGDLKSKVMLVIKSKVKEVAEGMNVSGDFAETLNEVLVSKVKMAAKRSAANGRKTVSAKDL